MSIEIRKLTVKDNRFLIKKIKGLVSDFNHEWLSTAISDKQDDTSEGSDDKSTGAFLKIIELLIDCYESDFTQWFADLCGKDLDEYLSLDFDTDAEVISQIVKDKGFKGFFSRASDAAKSHPVFGPILSNAKMRLDSMTESQKSSSEG